MAVHVLILTALQDELEAVLAVPDDGVAGWMVSKDDKGFRCYRRRFDNGRGGQLWIATAWIGEMGGRMAVMRAQQLINELAPRCLAMCGICAGDRKKVALGDVVIADQLYSYDDGKIIAPHGKPRETLHSARTFDLHATWKMDAAFLAREIDLATISRARPISRAAQRRWLLSTLLKHEDAEDTAPTVHPDRHAKCPDWTEVLRETQRANLVLLQAGRLTLTPEGRDNALDNEILYPDGLPDDPPFQVHVGAIATGASVQEDEELFNRLKRVVRTTIAVEMEGAAIGHVAEHFNRQAIVVKAVSDHADLDKDDSFRAFACRASAEVLMAFLLKQVECEPCDEIHAPDLGSDESASNKQPPIDRTADLLTLLLSWRSLAKSLTQRQWDAISTNLSQELIEKWIEVALSLPSDDGTLASLFVGMWREACHLDKVPPVSALDARVDLTALTRVFVEKRPFWTCTTQSTPLAIGPRLRASEAKYEWGIDAWGSAYPLAGPLFEVIWDMLKAQNDRKITIDTFDVRWWTAAGGITDDGATDLFLWPVVDMSTFSEYEKMAEAWNDACSRATRISKQIPNDSSTADNLAYWYVEHCHQLWHTNAMHFSAGDLRGAISHLTEAADRYESSTNSRSEERPYATWTRALPLLAAPESGLSYEAASGILAGAQLNELRCRELHDLRLRRIRECRPDEKAEDILSALDAKYPDHPWFEYVRHEQR